MFSDYFMHSFFLQHSIFLSIPFSLFLLLLSTSRSACEVISSKSSLRSIVNLSCHTWNKLKPKSCIWTLERFQTLWAWSHLQTPKANRFNSRSKYEQFSNSNQNHIQQTLDPRLNLKLIGFQKKSNAQACFWLVNKTGHVWIRSLNIISHSFKNRTHAHSCFSLV